MSDNVNLDAVGVKEQTTNHLDHLQKNLMITQQKEINQEATLVNTVKYHFLTKRNSTSTCPRTTRIVQQNTFATYVANHSNG